MRWLVPALGVAAGVTLWFALQPAQPPTQTMPTQTIVQSPTVVPSAPGTDLEIAQDEAPRASSSQPTLLAQRSAAELRREPGARQEQESDEALTASAAAPADASDSTAFIIARGESPAAAQSGEARGAIEGAREGAIDSLAATAPAAALPAPSSDAEGKAAAETPEVSFLAREQDAILAVTALQPATFFSPDQSVHWRVGAAGRIDRSVDQGRSWQEQPSGVAADLVAGAAPSSQTAWIVGRAGVILRSTDGTSWERIAPPNGLLRDWTGIEASDALHATIESQDQQRFRTEDGGRTWTQQ